MPSAKPASLAGVSLTMFLAFAGVSSTQFHSYLFEHRGSSALQVGVLLAAGSLAGIASPLLQVRVIRLFHGARFPLLLSLLGAALTLAALPHVAGFGALLAIFFLFSFFAAGVLPLNTACTLEAMRHRGHGLFFRIRSLGTVGFLSGCIVSAFFTGFAALPWLYLGFSAAYGLALAVVARTYPAERGMDAGPEPRLAGPEPHHEADPGSGAPAGPKRVSRTGSGTGRHTFARTFALLREGRTGRLLLAMGVMNFANGLTICMQGNYLVHRWAGGQASISMAWIMSTACEIPIFLLCAYVLRRYGLRYVLGMGLAGTLVKVAGLALASELWQYFLALSMHGFFFAAAITGFNVYLDRTHAREDLPSLQALSAVFFQGLPNAMAGLVAGLVWHMASLRAVYLLAAGIAGAAAVYGMILLRNGASRPRPTG